MRSATTDGLKGDGMYKQLKPVNESEESRIHRELGTWAWDSHYWIEHAPGYAKCKWCGTQHTSEMGIGYDYPICLENPRVMTLDFIESLLIQYRANHDPMETGGHPV